MAAVFALSPTTTLSATTVAELQRLFATPPPPLSPPAVALSPAEAQALAALLACDASGSLGALLATILALRGAPPQTQAAPAEAAPSGRDAEADPFAAPPPSPVLEADGVGNAVAHVDGLLTTWAAAAAPSAAALAAAAAAAAVRLPAPPAASPFKGTPALAVPRLSAVPRPPVPPPPPRPGGPTAPPGRMAAETPPAPPPPKRKRAEPQPAARRASAPPAPLPAEAGSVGREWEGGERGRRERRKSAAWWVAAGPGAGDS